MTKMLVFDMDGTIADLYGVEGWLKDLRNGNPRPYTEAAPMYNMDALAVILDTLKTLGWTIAITSWLAKGSNKEYDTLVREAKKAWLAKYKFPYDEIHIVKYGTTKADCTRKHGGFQILIDDTEVVRRGWSLGDTIDANKNIIPILKSLIENK